VDYFAGFDEGIQWRFVIPAKAGIQRLLYERHWIPAFAGMTTSWKIVAERESQYYFIGRHKNADRNCNE
jgi:hypothetical protein